MSWLMRLGYLLLAAGALTPISGAMLDRDLHRNTHPFFTYLAATLFLLGLLALVIGMRNRGERSQR